MSGEVPEIIPVDNAAQIFVAINSKKETTISRIAVTLKKEINRERMNLALARIIERFPFFRVHLKKQFLDYVFKRTDDVPVIEDDTQWTNRYVDFKAGYFPFRVASSSRISGGAQY